MAQEDFFKRYTYTPLFDRIGGGSFGTVYRAFDNVLHREVAIKVSEVKTTANGKKTFSLKDELEALSHVPQHPNIANYEEFYSFEMPNGIFDYAVMQYYPDGNLSNAIKQGLTEEQKEDIAAQLLEGIDLLHQYNVIHCDLKPDNILIERHEGRIIPLITDFGLSKAAGTPRYSSPEQLQGQPLHFNTDFWSYGTIIYELFTGNQLFSANSGAANIAQADMEIYNKIVNGDVQSLGKMPEKWRKVAERCLVVDAGKRVTDVGELFAIIDDETEILEDTLTPSESDQLSPKPQGSSSDGNRKLSIKKIFLILLIIPVSIFLCSLLIVVVPEIIRSIVKHNKYTSVESVFVSGNDVYAVGSICSGTSETDVPTLWKNGVAQKVGKKGNFNKATSVFVSGDDVYVSVSDREAGKAILWKNGESQLLGEGKANCVFVYNDDVYVAGQIGGYDGNVVVWKNGNPEILAMGGTAKSVVVHGDDVYVAGFIGDYLNYSSAILWKNGEETLLGEGRAESVFVSDNGDVYVAGVSGSGREETGALWINGEMTALELNSAQSVCVSDRGNVFVAGYCWSGAAVWVDGVCYHVDEKVGGWGYNYTVVANDNKVYIGGTSKDGIWSVWKYNSETDFSIDALERVEVTNK